MTSRAHPGILRRAFALALTASLLVLTVGVTPVLAATLSNLPTSSEVKAGSWVSLDNAYADDTSYASGLLDKSSTIGVAYGDFGFGAIPAGSTINSVTAEARLLFSVNAGSTDAVISLGALVGGAPSGSPAQNAAQPTAETTLSNATLGITSRSQLLDGSFQVLVGATRGTAGQNDVFLFIDYVQVTVDYTPPPPNQAPVPDTIGSQTVVAAITKSVDVSATDPEGDPITIDFDPTFPEPVPGWVTLADHGDGTATLTMAPGASVTGSHAVSLRFRDSGGNASFELVSITVTANQPPVLAPIGNQVVKAGSTKTVALSATDPDAGDTLTISKWSGQSWVTVADNGDGTATLTLSPGASDITHVAEVLVTDAADNSDFEVFTVYVDDAAPVVTVPAPITAEAAGPDGASVDFMATATDDLDPNPLVLCSTDAEPLVVSGHVFPIGVTTVNCGAMDAAGNISEAKSFTITVVDTTAPVVTVPADITVPATSAGGAAVDFTLTVTDAVDPAPIVACSSNLDPIVSPGDTFPVGVTTVNCGAMDAAGNISEAKSFTITVVDTTAPVVTVPADITKEATGPSGAAVDFAASATDAVDGPITPYCLVGVNVATSGDTFPLGTTTVTCSATDAAGNTGSASFTITIVDTTAPDLTVPADMTVPASSPTGAVVAFTATATDAVDGPITPTCAPASGEAFPIGSTTVTCTATDSAGNTGSNSFSVTVENQAPVLDPIPDQTIVAGATTSVTISATDPNGDPVRFSQQPGYLPLPTWADLVDNLDGTATIVMHPDTSVPAGTTLVFVQAKDVPHGLVQSNLPAGYFHINVVANQPPLIDPVPDQTMAEGATKTVKVFGTDPEGTSLVFSATGLPAFASYGNIGDHFEMTFTPGYTDAGTYPITATAEDEAGLTDTISFTLTVTDANRAPVLDPIGTQSVVAGGSKTVTITATDPDGDPLTFGSAGLPGWVMLAPAAPGSATLTLAPGVGDAGSYSVVIAVRDPGNATDSERITINVTAAPNQPPVLDPIPDQLVDEGATKDYLITAADPEGHALTFVQSQGWPSWATLTDNGDGTATLHLAPDFMAAVGSPYAGLTVGVTDGTNTVTDTFDIVVTDVNQPPVLDPIGDHTVAEGATKDIAITAIDVDGDALSFAAGPLPLLPFVTFTDNGDGTAKLHLAPGFTDAGSYQLTIAVTDLVAGNPPASETITITVTSTNQAPVLTPVPDQTVAEGATKDVTIKATDPDGDALTFVQSQGWPSWATLTDNKDGTATLHLAPDYAASASSPYVLQVGVTDLSATVTDTFAVVVTDTNRPPVLDPIGNQALDEGTTKSITIRATDPDGDPLVFVAGPTPFPSFVTFTDNGDGTATLDLAPGYTDAGSYPFMIGVTDGVNAPVTEAFTITVGDINAPPVLAPIGAQTVDEGATKTIAITASDIDGDSLTFGIGTHPSWVALTDNGDGTATLTLTPGYTDAGGPFTVRIGVTDGTDSDYEDVSITVLDANAPPVLAPIGPQTVGAGTIKTVTVRASDIDGDALTFGIGTHPSFVDFTDNGNGTATLTLNPVAGDVAGSPYTVRIGVTDGIDSDYEDVSITVVADTTPPVVTVPADITKEATGPAGAVATFTAFGTDAVDGDLNAVCTPASGATFALGQTIVTCEATDLSGNTGSATFKVTVVDTTAPVVTVPANVTASATGPGGAAVTYGTATATDLVDGSITPTCTPASGTTFALGTTTVTCTATDKAGNTGTATFTVTVTDTTAPVVKVPKSIKQPATSPAGAFVTFKATATDAVDGSTAVTCRPPSGSRFPVGTTTVRCTSVDKAGNTGSSSFQVTITKFVAPSVSVPPTSTLDAGGPGTPGSGLWLVFAAIAGSLAFVLAAVRMRRPARSAR